MVELLKSEIRVHLEWIHGEWIQPEYQGHNKVVSKPDMGGLLSLPSNEQGHNRVVSKPDMGDEQRFQRIEESQERMLQQLNDMLRSYNMRFDNLAASVDRSLEERSVNCNGEERPPGNSGSRGRGVHISLGKRPASTCEIGSTSKLSEDRKKRMKNKDEREMEELSYGCELDRIKKGKDRKKRMKNKDKREMEELPFGFELDRSKEGEDRKKRMKNKDQREMGELPHGCELDRSKEGEDTFRAKQDEHLSTPLAETTRRPVTTQEREKAKHLAQMLKTERASFMVVMKPSYLRKGLNVPLAFAREHFTERAHNVTLKLPDGRTWSVQFYLCKIKALLSGGWKAFVQENMLEDGDCCVFELLKVEEIELKVSIFRVIEKVVQPGSSVIARRKLTIIKESKATREARDFKSEYPFFKVYMHPSYAQRSYMIMRASFIKRHLEKNLESVILQDADGSKWPIRCNNKDGQSRLGCGWAEFAKKNNIKEGDVCAFELIERKDAVLKVTIFRSH